MRYLAYSVKSSKDKKRISCRYINEVSQFKEHVSQYSHVVLSYESVNYNVYVTYTFTAEDDI